MVILTKTTISEFLTCEKKYYLSQVHGYRRIIPPKAMLIGTALHTAKELFSLGTEPAKVLLEVKVIFADAFKNSWYTGDECKVMETIAYHGAMNCPWPFIEGSQAEAQFLLPVNAVLPRARFDMPMQIGGKIDEVVPLRDKVQLVDYKTRDSLNNVGSSWFTSTLSLDLQQVIYAAAYKAQHNIKIDSFEFRYIKRPGIRQTKKETPDRFLARLALEYSDRKNVDKYYASCVVPQHNAQRVIENLEGVSRRLSERLSKGGWEMNPLSCIYYNKACPYLPLCNGDVGWKDLYEDVGPDHHPELDLGEE